MQSPSIHSLSVSRPQDCQTPDFNALCASWSHQYGVAIDPEASRVVVFPLPVRDYQRIITVNALRHNTMVCLPTGSGKTFVAAAVIFNFLRWFPQGRVIFLAPTRPLVVQQFHAITSILSLPPDSICSLTGVDRIEIRRKKWHQYRLLVSTPHVLASDLDRADHFQC